MPRKSTNIPKVRSEAEEGEWYTTPEGRRQTQNTCRWNETSRQRPSLQNCPGGPCRGEAPRGRFGAGSAIPSRADRAGRRWADTDRATTARPPPSRPAP